MKSEIIDRLYDIYINEDELIAQDVLMSAYLRPESQGGRDVLVNHIKDYISANIGNLPNYYSSKEAENERDSFIANVVSAMSYLTTAIDHYRYEVWETASKEVESYNYEEEDYSSEFVLDEDESFDDYVPLNSRYIDMDLLFERKEDVFEDFSPQDLFFMGTDAMEIAYKKYKHKVPKLTEENFYEIKRFIEYVKQKDLVSKLFVNNDINKISIDMLVSVMVDADANLMRDFHIEQLQKVKHDEDYEGYLLFDYFQYMKAGCDQIKTLDFTEYRSTFVSKRGFNVDLDKIVFARNYLEFIRTGMIPSSNGNLYLSTDGYSKFNVEEEFLKIYRKGFNNREFAEKQGNYIFDIDNAILFPDRFEKIKAVRSGKELSIGCLLSSRIVMGKAEYDETYYLMHIHIDDILNNKSNYELQLNVLPMGNFDNRVQLVRFDNWAEEQTHKNIGNKLKTTTHIHLYNHFDLLRGKKNGGYDIAFNLEEDSTDFNVALKVFLEFVCSDEKLHKDLLDRISRVKKYAVEKAVESEMI